jgi:hypothetical protein
LRSACPKQNETNKSHFTCEEYNLSDGVFVKSSQKEIVTSIRIVKLLRSWKQLGLKTGSSKCKDDNSMCQGTSRTEFIEIIKTNGAVEIQSQGDDDYDFVEYTTFYLGDYFYEAKIWTYKTGLRYLDVFEGY